MNDPRPLVIHGIPLRLGLPLLFSLAMGVMVAVMVWDEVQQERQWLRQWQSQVLRLINAQSSLPLRRALEAGRLDDVRSIVSSINLYEDVEWVILGDPQGRILESSRYAWRGLPLDRILPDTLELLPPGGAHDSIQILTDGDRLLSVVGIDYRDPRRPERILTAQLWTALDMARQERVLAAELLREGLVLAAIALFFLGIVLWLLSRYVTQPLARLATVSCRLARTHQAPPLEIRGRGEIVQLAQTMARMAGDIRDTIDALQESEQRLSVTLDAIGDAVLVTDAQGLVTRLNPVAERLTGWTQEEALGRPILEIFNIVNAETREPAENPVGRALREGIVVGLANHTTLIARDGSEYQIADSAAPIRDPEGRILGVIMVFQDVTDRYALESELRRTKDRLQAILSSLPDLCFLLDRHGRYLDILGGPDALLADERERLIGRTVAEVLPPEEAAPILRTIETTVITRRPQRLEYALDTLSGRRYFEGTTAVVEDHDGLAVIWLARDTTERRRAEEQLRQLVRYDPLTGLANRVLAEQHIAHALARARRNGHYGAVMFLDVDRFKNINDSLGHPVGDQLLIELGATLRQTLRGEDLAARFGGDEFVIVLEDLGPDRLEASARAEHIAEKLRHACATPFVLGEHQQQVSVSIGIVLFPDDDCGVDELLKRADIAMYKAKEGGRNRICFFSPELQEIAEARLQIHRDLQRGLQEGQLQLYVQPRVDVHGRWTGGEVLVRWAHPQRGLLAPGGFIGVAEHTGLIDDLDMQVISRTIRQLGACQKDLPEHFRGLSMNVTAALLLQPGFPDELRHWCLESALPPERLGLEITERVLLADHDKAARVIEQLRDLGLHFAIDDFGTGYPSLRYLQRLPIHTVKIDRSFVERLPGHAGDARIAITILDMARGLGLEVIAEGVEREEQVAFLKRHGCREFQGYLYARPLPWDEFFRRLRAERPAPEPA